MSSTVELEWLSHGGLNVDTLKIVPSLLEEGNQEVDSHKNVLSDFILSHLFVTDGDVHAGNLLKLELNAGSSIIDL